jgi:hypothetical protein
MKEKYWIIFWLIGTCYRTKTQAKENIFNELCSSPSKQNNGNNEVPVLYNNTGLLKIENSDRQER